VLRYAETKRRERGSWSLSVPPWFQRDKGSTALSSSSPLSLSFGRRELRGGGEERMSKKEAKQKALYPGATHGQKAPNCDFYVSLLPSPWGEGKSMRNCCC